MYYLLSQSPAPFVVANLWDVTDKDIDMLSMEFMNNLFSSYLEKGLEGRTSHSAASALVHARDVCKMKNAVGSAPVVYGIPLRLVLEKFQDK
jgi:separase